MTYSIYERNLFFVNISYPNVLNISDNIEFWCDKKLYQGTIMALETTQNGQKIIFDQTPQFEKRMINLN